jgi:hypothetical protein
MRGNVSEVKSTVPCLGNLTEEKSYILFLNLSPAWKYRKCFKNVIYLVSSDDVTIYDSNLLMTHPHSHVTRSIYLETNTSEFLNLGTSVYISNIREDEDLDKFFNN